MRMFHRTALLGGLAILAGLSASFVSAADYPVPGKPVHLLVGFSAGGDTDLAARLLAGRLEQELGTPVVVENYAAGGGLEAINRLISAPPDGHTIMLAPLPASVMLYLDPERGGTFTSDDIIPIAMHDYSVAAIATAADGKWETMAELLEAAAAAPGSVTGASSGVLANGHLNLMLLNQAGGIEINWTTFETAGMMRSAVLGQHVDFEISGLSEVGPAIQSGDMRLLAVFAEERVPEFPDTPTLLELGFDVTQTSNRAVIAPKGTPPNAIEVLSRTIETISVDPAYQAEAAARQVTLRYRDSAEATTFWKDMEETYRPLVEQFRLQ